MAGVLQLTPSSVEFSTEAREQVVVVTVKNVDARTRTVRLRPPKGAAFSTRGFHQSVKLAGGLETTFEVIFHGSKLEAGREFLSDKVVVQSDAGEVELELKAVAPKAQVTLRGDLHFGLLPLDSKASKKLELSNTGGASTSWKVMWDRSLPIKVTPAEGELAALNGSIALTVTITVGDSSGPIAGELQLNIGPEASDVRRIQFSSTAVKQGFEILDSSGLTLPGLDFGSLYFGESAVRQVVVYNNGPIEARYILNHGALSEMKALVDHDKGEGGGTVGNDPDDPYADYVMAARQKIKARSSGDNPFTVTPLTATLAPYSKATLSVQFTPKGTAPGKGFNVTLPTSDATSRSYDYLAVFEFSGTTAKMQLPMRAKGHPGGIRTNPASLTFGDVPTNNWADLLVDMTNTSSVLPVKYAVQRGTPYFEVSPASGVVPSAQTVQLLVRYNPKAMGHHAGSLPIWILSNSGTQIQEVQLQVAGTSLRVGDKPALLGGTDKLPSDFEKQRHYVDDEQIILSKLEASHKTGRFLAKPWEKVDVAAAFDAVGMGGAMTLSKGDFMTLTAHRDKATATMRAKRTLKQRAAMYGKVDENDVNLGMNTRSGLHAPEPKIQKTVDPLWTVESCREGAPRSQRTWSEKELAGIPMHKDHPEGEVERVQCTRELSKEELVRLIVGPKTLDFGKVSVGASVTQYLVVANTLDQPIHVVLDLKQHPDFKTSTNSSQIIPAGLRAKFPVTLAPLEPHVIGDAIEYSINGQHMLSFATHSSVSAVNVELSSEDLQFEFSLDNWDDAVERVLVLDNPDKFPVAFSLESTHAAFMPSVTQGTIKQQSSMEVTIRWAPPTDGSATGQQEGYLIIKLVGGEAPRKVFVRGELPEGCLKLREKVLDAGAVPCGLPQTLIMQVKNMGTRESAFRVLPSSLLKVSPDRAKVAPDETMDVEVTFTCVQPGSISETLEVQVRGSKTLLMPFRAEGVVPVVEVLQDELTFAPTFVGATARSDVTLVNTTGVPATLTVDLTPYPEFQLAIAKDAWDPAEYEACPLKSFGLAGSSSQADRLLGQVGSARRMSGRRSTNGTTNLLGGGDKGQKYQIQINPSKQLQLQMVYRPTSTAAHAFDLTLATVSSGPGTEVPPIRKVVTASGVQPRLVISQTAVDFGTRIVIRSNQIKAPYATDLFLQNTDSEPLRVSFGEAITAPDTASGILSLDVAPGTDVVVAPGIMVQVRMAFTPRDAKGYEATFPVYLDGDTSAPYLQLEAQGQGQFPRISFDMRECTMPAVPLGVRSQAMFHILNNGFDNLELKYRLPADESHLPMQIEFPQGTLIGIAKEKLPVVVSFTSPKPISFTANIDFMDEEGQRYSIPISGTSDNCLLTHTAFMQVNADALVFTAEEGKPVRLEEREYTLPPPSTALGPTTSNANVLRYLNATTAKGQLEDVAKAMLTSRGKLLVELVEGLSGKAVPGKAGKLSGNKKDAAKQLLAQYDAILVFLKSHGALLNAVKPEMLLDQDDLTRVLNERLGSSNRVEDAEALELWADVEDNFDTISSQCWNLVLLQLFKVFVLSRVTVKTLKALTSMGPAGLPPDSCLIGSNVFSVPECILLAWASAQYAREFGTKATRVTNFDSDFASGAVLFSLLSGYWPALSIRKKLLRLGNSNGGGVRPGDYRDNADLIIKLLAELNLPFEVNASELCEPSPPEMMVLVLYLYLTLPQFVPRTTVEFHCRLGESQSKDLELTNPSKKCISYTARLEGNRDFAIESSLVRLDPKASIRFAIKCTPTMTLPEEARLVLMSRKDAGGAHAATLVFLLQSKVNTRAPLKRVRTEGPLYELQSFDFTIANPFPADGDFTLTLLHEPAEPLPKKEPEEKGKNGTRRNGGSKAATLTQLPVTDGPRMWPHAFGLDRTRLRLKQGASDKVRGFFLPFTLGTHYCTLVLKDKEQGECCYELCGEAGLPAPLLEVKGTIPMEAPAAQQLFDLSLPYVNTQLEGAKRLFIDRHPLGKDREQLALVKADPFKQGEVQYTVVQSNTLVTCPAGIKLLSRPLSSAASDNSPNPNPSGPGKGGKTFTILPPEPNTLRLHLKPIGTGIYPTRLQLVSPMDVRVVDVELTAQTMTQNFMLEFNTTARQTITQEVPLVNTNSESAMVVSASITGAAFSGSREVSVPAGATIQYPLQFRPLTTGESKGMLELSIGATGERNIYTLVGRAQEPVAEGLIIVECEARKPATKAIAVPNIIGQTVDYKVLCDLDFVSGPESVRCTMGVAATYKLTAAPNRSGHYMGSITFTTADNQFVWYSLEVRVTEPPAVGVVEVSSVVRKAVQVQIGVVNPTDKPLEMQVKYTDPELIGASTITLPPSSGGAPFQFGFFYAPLKPGSSLGTVSLVSDELGEFAYEVRMQAEEAPPEAVPEIKAELGSKGVHMLTFDNPLDHPITLTSTCSNTRNYSVNPTTLTLGPYGSAEVAIEYSPSCLDIPEHSQIAFHSDDIGDWDYRCSGRGQAPTSMPPTTLYGLLGGSAQGSLTWRNPFSEPVMVSVAISSHAPDTGSFELLRSSPQASVAAYGSLAVPLSFKPLLLQTCPGEVTVTLVHNSSSSSSSIPQVPLVWRYPLVGTGEARAATSVFKFSTRARSRLVDVIEVVLAGLASVNAEEDQFTHELLIPAEARSSLQSALTIVPLATHITSPEQPLRYELCYCPQHTLPPTSIELVVHKAGGGRWRFEVQVQATEPDSDGVLIVEAKMGQSASLPLRLYSSTTEPQPFTAAFPPDTSLLFNVIPAQGLLPSRPAPGQPEPEAPLNIVYTCKDFSKVVKGKVMIHTSDMQYTFEVWGRVPDYVPPTPAQFKPSVDNRLAPEVASRLSSVGGGTGRNHVSSNIKTIRKGAI